MNTRFRRAGLSLLLSTTLVIGPLFAAPIHAQEGDQSPATPGSIFGTGTEFAVTDSHYLNVSLSSTADVEVSINSFPTMILVDMAALTGETRTDITLGGLEANTLYWIYQNQADEAISFTTDADGRFVFSQDLSEPQFFRIQPEKSTVDIYDDGSAGTGNQCTNVGTWDPSTKTCTLTDDVFETIRVQSSGVTLDGAGYTVAPASGGGIIIHGSDHTIKNLVTQGQLDLNPVPANSGVYLWGAHHITVENVTVEKYYHGIYLGYSPYNTIIGNTFTDVVYGVRFTWVRVSPYRCDMGVWQMCGNSYTMLSDNVFVALSDAPISTFGFTASHGSRDNTIMGNTFGGFVFGVVVDDGACPGSYCSGGYSIYGNNFFDIFEHPIHTRRGGAGDTVFNLDTPIGGNYYSDYDQPAEGCYDSNADGFCDTERPVFSLYAGFYGADYLPLTRPAGNSPPVVEAGGPYSGDEGAPITISATATDDDGDPLIYTWSVDYAGCRFNDASALATTVTCDDNGSYTLTMTVSDGTDSVADTASVTVANVAPTVAITAPLEGTVIPIYDSIQVAATLSDPGSADTHTCMVNFGDGTAGQSPYCDTSIGLTSHLDTYSEAGVYEILVTATDDDGGRNTASVMIVVYDPSAGFVTGGGWIESLAGAYKPDASLTGKANFGFVSKYKKGASVPSGETQFVFKAGDLNFHSATYQWLVVNQNGVNAQYKGTGTINGSLDANGKPYGFMLWAGDGDNSGVADDPDTFRIRIWSEDNSVETDVYDNGAHQPIGGGSVVIHTGGKKK